MFKIFKKKKPEQNEIEKDVLSTQLNNDAQQIDTQNDNYQSVDTPREDDTQQTDRKSIDNPTESSENLQKGLEKTRGSIWNKLSRTVVGKSKINEDILDNLEELLVSSDVGIETTIKIIERIERRVAKDKYLSAEELNTMLKEEIVGLLTHIDEDDNTVSGFNIDAKDIDNNPFVIMVVGVNGVGKTTTIGKIAARLQSQGKKVFIGAADTFRAAAIEQLEVWAARANATIVKQHMGADPASVAYDTLTSAKVARADVVLIDTAGRLHNKVGLMNELTKIRNVMQKVIPNAPHEVILVLDGSTGQNAYEQAKQFAAATQVTSLAITKLDGTAKGGVVIGISDQMKIPVRFIGVGEKVEDLQIFNAQQFVEAIFR